MLRYLSDRPITFPCMLPRRAEQYSTEPVFSGLRTAFLSTEALPTNIPTSSSGERLLLYILALLFFLNIHVGSHYTPQADLKNHDLPEPPHAGNLSVYRCAQHFVFFILATLTGERDNIALRCWLCISLMAHEDEQFFFFFHLNFFSDNCLFYYHS